MTAHEDLLTFVRRWTIAAGAPVDHALERTTSLAQSLVTEVHLRTQAATMHWVRELLIAELVADPHSPNAEGIRHVVATLGRLLDARRVASTPAVRNTTTATRVSDATLHATMCAAETGFKVCYCMCDWCTNDDGVCACPACGEHHPAKTQPTGDQA